MFCVARQGQALQGAKTTEIESKPLVMWRNNMQKVQIAVHWSNIILYWKDKVQEARYA